MKLTFGKYFGLDTADTDIPLRYLIWLESQPWINSGPNHKGLWLDVKQEIEKRTGTVQEWVRL